MVEFSQSVEDFHASARAARELEDFGEDDYREALDVLCRSLDEDAHLTPMGEVAVERMIVDALEARLLVEAGWTRFPEAAEARVERPLIIIGLPRTGTTALHHLIAQDPGIQGLEHWLQRTPKPRPPRGAWKTDPDFLAAETRLRLIFDQSPDLRVIHEIAADLPDECWNLFSQNFAHSSWQANVDVPQYAAWWARCDMTPVYRRHRRNAQLIGHREPEKRWLFKDATHLFDLNALLAVYPDAMIVQPHRDPASIIPSVCSLCWSSRRALNEGTDIAEFGRSTLDVWVRSIDAMMRDRARHDPRQFHDLAFEDFVADPVAAIRGIYAHFDLEYTREADDAIEAFRAANPKGKHGEHRYDLEEWGLDAAEIRERFQTYTEAYDVRTMI